MGEKVNRSKGIRIAVAFVVLFVIIRMIQPVLYFTSPDFVECQTLVLDDGWDIYVHGQEYKNATISETLFEMCNRGDTVVLSRILPDSPKIASPVMRVYSVHSVVDVFLDDELIYSYGHENYEAGNLLGYGQNHVLLPDSYPGKEIKIVYTVTEDNAFEGIPCINIYTGTTMLQKEIAARRVSLAISLFLMTFGVLGMCLSLYMLLANNTFVRTFCISLFSFVIGLWTLCNTDMISFFSTTLCVKVYLEYISFYLMILPLLGYFGDRVKQPYCKRWLQIFYYILFAANVLFVGTIFILQFLNIVHFPAFVIWNHVFIGVTLIFILCEEISSFQVNRKAEPSLLIGFGIAITVAVVELCRYNLSKYIIGFKGNEYDNTMGIATLILVIALFADFGNKVTKNMYAEAEEKLLKKLAYMDELTGLANRRRCEDAMKDLEDAKEPYAIICMDMNGLKLFNDTYGHDCGDLSLKAFADTLHLSFPDKGIIGRMGGDEFIVILSDGTQKTAEKYMKDMLANMETYNKNSNGPIYLSTAYGCAYSNEAETSHAVYTLADARMYECKRAMKEQESK